MRLETSDDVTMEGEGKREMAARADRRLATLRKQMQSVGADLVTLAPGTNMQWLLGFSPHADERLCLLLVGRTNEVFVMPALNAEDVRTQTNIDFEVWADADGPLLALDKALGAVADATANSVVLDDPMRVDFALPLLDRLPGAARQFSESTFGALRLSKDAAECNCLKDNAAIADKAMKAAFSALKPGVKEVEVAEVVNAAFRSEGARPEFCIVGSGPNSSYPHHHTGNRALQHGDPVLIDLGGTKDGYWSDITRMAVVGELPEGYAEIHEIVEDALESGRAAIRDGAIAAEVDAATRSVIENAGYGKFFVHRTGHGLGVEVHEPPYLTAGSDEILRAGMVFSVEPGIYLPGKFGVRLEEIITLKEDGPKILSSLPRTVHVAVEELGFLETGGGGI